MSQAAFIDANVPIYAAGRDHPHKAPCVRILGMVVHDPEASITNAEVLREMLHRYLATDRWTLGREVVTSFAELMAGRIESVYLRDVLLAAELANEHQGVSARNLVHAAVMRRLQIAQIISADSDFGRVPGIERRDPLRLDEWQATLSGTWSKCHGLCTPTPPSRRRWLSPDP